MIILCLKTQYYHVENKKKCIFKYVICIFLDLVSTKTILIFAVQNKCIIIETYELKKILTNFRNTKRSATNLSLQMECMVFMDTFFKKNHYFEVWLLKYQLHFNEYEEHIHILN